MLSKAIFQCTELGKKIGSDKANKPRSPNPESNSHDTEPSKDTKRFQKLENDMTEIKSNMAELKELMLGTAKTYAQAAATNINKETTKPTKKQLQTKNQPTKEKQREARRPYEVKLTNQHMPDPSKKEFAEMHNKDVIKRLQAIIDNSNIKGKKPLLQAGNKFPNGIRLQCDTLEFLFFFDFRKSYGGRLARGPRNQAGMKLLYRVSFSMRLFLLLPYSHRNIGGITAPNFPDESWKNRMRI